MVANTFIPQIHVVGDVIVVIAKKGLTLTLFLIGSGLTRKTLNAVGLKPFLLGAILWVLISVGSLLIILETVK
jgi:uncharacterized membrane protein YadS